MILFTTNRALYSSTTKRAIVSFILCMFIIVANGQQDSINHKKLAWVIAGESTAYGLSMLGLSSIWYSQYDKQSFRFFDDSREWYQMDKLGHFYSTFQIAALNSRVFSSCRLNKRKADVISSISSWVMVSSIEIFDGRSTGYGASASDLTANALGSGLYLGQQLIWNETRIYPKFSFHTTAYANQRPALLGKNLHEQIIKDYNGQSYWLSIDLDKFVKVPKWINVGIGYGAEGMTNANPSLNSNAFRKYYIGLDIDTSAIKSKSKLINSMVYLLSLVRIPAPTFEFSDKKVKLHAFYF